MKQYTTPEQTTKLIELGFKKPRIDAGVTKWDGWEVKDNLGDLMSYSSKMFDTYELALEDALKYALENLV